MTLQHLDTVIAFAVVMLGTSLLITILTQTVSTFFAYRGSNLRWGLKVLFKTINPDLTDTQAKDIALRVLTHEILSDSVFSRLHNVWLLGLLSRRWRLASAVRMEELLRILPAVAGNQAQPANNPGALAIAQMVAAADADAAQQIVTLLDTLRALAPAQAAEAQQRIQQMAAAAQTVATHLTNNVKSWFDSAMDRVSQRFALQMRIWTVVFSLVLAFGAHLDVFRLYTQLSSDAELRAKLAGSADAITKQAAAVLPPQAGGTGVKLSVVPGIFSGQMKQLKSQEPGATKNLGDPPSFDSRQTAIKWLRDGMNGDNQTERLVAEYQQLVDAGLISDADKLLDQSANVQNILSNTGYQLIPDPYPQPWYGPWETFGAREFWGTLVAAALLSLGAPFWFNALKTLTSLQPIVAGKEQKEKKQAAA